MSFPLVAATEVKACPFCKSKDLQISDWVKHPKTNQPFYWVNCKRCDADGPMSATIDGAIKHWNTRYDV